MINSGLSAHSKRVKKLIALVILIIASGLPAAHSEPLESYGEIILRQSLNWVPAYLKIVAQRRRLFKESEQEILRAENFYRVALAVQELSLDPTHDIAADGVAVNRMTWKADSPVSFARQSSGKFDLPGLPVRDAVTGDATDSPVLFNLDRLSDPEVFSFPDALRLWVHEFGHKVRALGVEMSMDEVNEYGALIAQIYGHQAIWSQASGGIRLLVVNGVPFNSPTDFSYPGYRLHPSRYNGYLNLQFKNRLHDLSQSFELQITAFHRPGADYIETSRQIKTVRWISERELILEMETYRQPKDLGNYFQSSLGGPFRKICHLRLSIEGEVPQLEVLSYEDSFPIPERAWDASAKIDKVETHSDGTFTGEIVFTLGTERFFHAVSMPTDHTGFLLAHSGVQSFKIPYIMHSIGDYRTWTGMPQDMYMKKVVRRARFEAKWPAGAGASLELTGIINVFFKMGLTWPEQGPDTFKLVTVTDPVTVTRCEAAL